MANQLPTSCPNCGVRFGGQPIVRVVQTDTIYRNYSLASAAAAKQNAYIKPTGRLWCPRCDYEIQPSNGAKTRRTQLKSEFGERNVHYGKLANLEQAGYTVPPKFNGTSEQLAKQLGITHSDLAQIVRTTEDELRQAGRFHISE